MTTLTEIKGFQAFQMRWTEKLEKHQKDLCESAIC